MSLISREKQCTVANISVSSKSSMTIIIIIIIIIISISIFVVKRHKVVTLKALAQHSSQFIVKKLSMNLQLVFFAIDDGG